MCCIHTYYLWEHAFSLCTSLHSLHCFMLVYTLKPITQGLCSMSTLAEDKDGHLLVSSNTVWWLV